MHHHHQQVEVEVESPPRESSRLVARPVAAGAGAAGLPACAENGPTPSQYEPGSHPAGSPSDPDAHHKRPSGSGTRHGESNTAAETGADGRRAADSGDALLELLIEVVLAGESGAATPVLEGGGAGDSSFIHILGMDLLISHTLTSLRLDLL
ncbi:unnamed protein product [Linum trigynum]|uniref:Uncharacterized protein n=1 Tax=Linum trigynum TaxID=586398 RepID=A0AAV2E8U9_9ROSI